jgi:hypothetical protein
MEIFEPSQASTRTRGAGGGMRILVVNTESELVEEFALAYQHESAEKRVDYYPFWELGSEGITVRFWVICIPADSTRTGSLSIFE